MAVIFVYVPSSNVLESSSKLGYFLQRMDYLKISWGQKDGWRDVNHITYGVIIALNMWGWKGHERGSSTLKTKCSINYKYSEPRKSNK